MTLAEIIAEAKRLDERVRVYHADNHRMLVSALNDRANFYATHFPLLVAVAEASLALFAALDNADPGWREENCTIGGGK